MIHVAPGQIPNIKLPLHNPGTRGLQDKQHVLKIAVPTLLIIVRQDVTAILAVVNIKLRVHNPAILGLQDKQHVLKIVAPLPLTIVRRVALAQCVVIRKKLQVLSTVILGLKGKHLVHLSASVLVYHGRDVYMRIIRYL